MKLQWSMYPNGAHVALFDEALLVEVVKENNAWSVMLRHGRPGRGVVCPCGKATTREDAILIAEKWLKDHVRRLLRLL